MFGRSDLEAVGFGGFVTFGDLRRSWLDYVPKTGGVYAVLRESGQPPSYLPSNPGGRFKGQDPTVPVSQRTTSARDLGRVLTTLHATAAGNATAQRAAGLTEHEARVGLALLLDSQPTGDNIGLFRPWLGPSLPVAQKQGWITSARHTAAIVYGPKGPVVVVLRPRGRRCAGRPGVLRRPAARRS